MNGFYFLEGTACLWITPIFFIESAPSMQAIIFKTHISNTSLAHTLKKRGFHQGSGTANLLLLTPQPTETHIYPAKAQADGRIKKSRCFIMSLRQGFKVPGDRG